MSISLSDNEFWVQSGSFPVGRYSLIDEKFTNGEIVIKISKLVSCTIVKDEHSTSQSGAGRIAGGILGAALLGPIGALGGLLAGGKKRVDQTIILCGFDDNRTFTAESTQLGAANLVRIAQSNLSSARNQSHVAQSASVIENDQIECPQCAELIKRKAKICRYCGLSLEDTLIPPKAIPNSTDLDFSSVPNHPYKKFLTDYRDQVKDSPFSSDIDVINAIDSFSKLYAKSSEKWWMPDIQKQLAKELKVLVSDVEKIIDRYWSLKAIFNSYRKINSPGSVFGDLTDAQLYQIISVISDVRFSNALMDSAVEKNAVQKVLSDTSETVFHGGYITTVQHCLMLNQVCGQFYIIDDHVLHSDPAIRKKKKRKISVKTDGVNPKISEILKSPDFIDWYSSYFSEQIKAQDVVRLYCGLLEVKKLYADLKLDAFFYIGLSEFITDCFEGNEGPDSNSPDRWVSKNYNSLLRDYNESEENGVDDDALVAKFELGFNGR
jgi:hypothetical protein